MVAWREIAGVDLSTAGHHFAGVDQILSWIFGYRHESGDRACSLGNLDQLSRGHP
jgi:hypothetical protein